MFMDDLLDKTSSNVERTPYLDDCGDWVGTTLAEWHYPIICDPLYILIYNSFTCKQGYYIFFSIITDVSNSQSRGASVLDFDVAILLDGIFSCSAF